MKETSRVSAIGCTCSSSAGWLLVIHANQWLWSAGRQYFLRFNKRSLAKNTPQYVFHNMASNYKATDSLVIKETEVCSTTKGEVVIQNQYPILSQKFEICGVSLTVYNFQFSCWLENVTPISEENSSIHLWLVKPGPVKIQAGKNFLEVVLQKIIKGLKLYSSYILFNTLFARNIKGKD